MTGYLTKTEQELTRAAIERWEGEGGRAFGPEGGVPARAGEHADSKGLAGRNHGQQRAVRNSSGSACPGNAQQAQP
jgi:hypothetical protein